MIIPKETAAKLFEEAVPIHRFLGVKVLELTDGYCKMLFPIHTSID